MSIPTGWAAGSARHCCKRCSIVAAVPEGPLRERFAACGAVIAPAPSLPTWGVSMLVTGREKTGKSALVRGLLERLCNAGYQFCVLDGRGEYLDFEPAIVFGTEEHAPDPPEVFTALEKPEVQAVVCLAAVPAPVHHQHPCVARQVGNLELPVTRVGDRPGVLPHRLLQAAGPQPHRGRARALSTKGRRRNGQDRRETMGRPAPSIRDRRPG